MQASSARAKKIARAGTDDGAVLQGTKRTALRPIARLVLSCLAACGCGRTELDATLDWGAGESGGTSAMSFATGGTNTLSIAKASGGLASGGYFTSGGTTLVTGGSFSTTMGGALATGGTTYRRVTPVAYLELTQERALAAFDARGFGGPLPTTMYAEAAPLRSRQFSRRDHHPYVAGQAALPRPRASVEQGRKPRAMLAEPFASGIASSFRGRGTNA
jgi:hypothetical protein